MYRFVSCSVSSSPWTPIGPLSPSHSWAGATPPAVGRHVSVDHYQARTLRQGAVFQHRPATCVHGTLRVGAARDRRRSYAFFDENNQENGEQDEENGGRVVAFGVDAALLLLRVCKELDHAAKAEAERQVDRDSREQVEHGGDTKGLEAVVDDCGLR
jgi:hypothetical protein